VLKYPRIRNKYAITDEDVKGLVALLEQEALVVPREVEIENVIPEDLADERVLACAVEAGADGIVSGDRHLLSLGAYRGISIVTAREFLERLRSNESEG
jgi:predicted nucleic acid-binding protein